MKPDPWSQVNDLDGTALYKTLGVHCTATTAELRKAYRRLAKSHHPDRGGSDAAFSQLQQAFEVLSDPRQREVYDTWARQVQFRYLPDARTQSKGGEDMLLDEFEGLGLHCNPQTQLVVTCEVCRRPASKECWTCGMKICDFCTLKRHWKGSFPLHWPLVNSNHMRTKLAKRELEKKRIEDDHRLALEDPNYRTQAQLNAIRSFRSAAQQMLQRADHQVKYSLELAQHYMWAQDDQHVFLAAHVPTGYEDKPVHLECNEHSLLLQPYNSPPVIDRLLAYAIDCQQPVKTFRSQDNTLFVASMTKGKLGHKWLRIFRGDPDGARSMQPIYTITESSDDVLLELQVPFWIEADDVHVDFGEQQLQVSVRNTFCFSRTYWTSSEQHNHSKSVDVDESMWTLDEDWDGSTDATHSLMISLARPAITAEEITWKKGKRQNNTTQPRLDSMQLKGYRFFADDEDHFGLEDILQAVTFMQSSQTFVPAKPWQHGRASVIVATREELTKEVQGHLSQIESAQRIA